MSGFFYITSRQFWLRAERFLNKNTRQGFSNRASNKKPDCSLFSILGAALPIVVSGLLSLSLVSNSFASQFDGNVSSSSASSNRAALEHAERLRLPTTIQTPSHRVLGSIQGTVPGRLINRRSVNSQEKQVVAVQLKAASVSALAGRSAGALTQRRAEVESVQAQFLQRAQRSGLPGLRVVGRVKTVLNAVFVEVDSPEAIAQLSKDPAVAQVATVPNYQLQFFNHKNTYDTAVSYVGANTFRWFGVTGRGIKVAVIDTGIDYTHAHLGGSGDKADYLAAYGVDAADPKNANRDGLFPTARVIAGYDFLGDVWPQGPLAPDDDPIDGQGHGTSAAAIIGGKKGVAPDVKFMAIKACATATLECPGFALVQALEFALDPNGDGDFSDRADIINWSLGRPYGQPFDDLLSTAVDAASAMGVLSVAAAGNEADRPYIVNTPGSAPTALSVAETHVPASRAQPFSVGERQYEGVLQLWSTVPASVVSGTLQYGNGAGGNLDGCQPFDPNEVAGQVILVDRGTCATAQKMLHVSDAGGILGFIGLVDDTEAFTTANVSDGQVMIPSYVVDLPTSVMLKSLLGQTVVVDPQAQVPLVRRIVGTSARGPQFAEATAIKPDIAAPGGLFAARAGTGVGESRFGGTSGAAPVVSGAAALLLQIRPSLNVAELKARLMNSAHSELFELNGQYAPITRVGSGEVRVTSAILAPLVAWEETTGQPSLSFGFVEAADPVVTIEKQVVLKNRGYRRVNVQSRPRFRFEADAQSSAVAIDVTPQQFSIAPGGEQRVVVRLTIQSSLLPENAMSSGADAISGVTLNLNEFDGFVDFWFARGRRVVQMPWHVLPRKSARTSVAEVSPVAPGISMVDMENTGVGAAQLEAFSLLALSPDLPDAPAGSDMPTPDIRALGIRTIPIGPGFCAQDESFLINIAINSWARQQLLAPVTYVVLVDVDPAPIPDPQQPPDFAILNSGQIANGQFDARQLTWVEDVNAGFMTANFFAEHATHTGNTILTLCAEQLGLSAADFGVRQMRLTVLAQDAYFGGPGDILENVVVTPGLQQFIGISGGDIAAFERGMLELRDLKSIPEVNFPEFQAPANTDELGLMVFTNGDRGPGLRGGATEATEMFIIPAPAEAP